MLLTYANRGGQGSADIFISRFSGGEWQEPANLGPSVNSAYAEFGAKLSADGKDIVFTSDRPVEGQPNGLLQVWIAPLPSAFGDD